MKVIFQEKDGIYTATIPLRARDGRMLYFSGTASLDDTYKQFAVDPQISGIFDDIGKVFKKVTKSKAFRGALKVVKSVVKSPITTAALGVVTGGAAIAPMAAANMALRVVESATKGSGKAKKLIEASMKLADKPMKPEQVRLLKAKIRASGGAPSAITQALSKRPSTPSTAIVPIAQPSAKVRELLHMQKIHRFVMTLQPTA